MTDANMGVRVLALEVRSRRIGYAVFEGPTKLLDWGVRNCATAGEATDITKRQGLVSLLNLYQPAMVVANEVRANRNGWKRTDAVKLAIGRECARRSIQLLLVPSRAITRFFSGHGCNTRLQTAQTLAGWFPELAWQVPSERKPWDGERHSMVIFGAAAAGITYFQREASLRPDRASTE